LPTSCSLTSSSVFFLSLPRPPTSTLFPYTTLFRSRCRRPYRSLPPLSKGPPCPIFAKEPRPRMLRKLNRRRSAGVAEWQTQRTRSEEHTSELQSPCNLVCRLLLEKKKHRRYLLLLA